MKLKVVIRASRGKSLVPYSQILEALTHTFLLDEKLTWEEGLEFIILWVKEATPKMKEAFQRCRFDVQEVED